MKLEQFRFIELTQLLSPDVPTWSGSCGFCLEIKKDYDQTFRVQQVKMHAGVGTHMDAPSHRFKDAPSIADIPLEQLIVPACLIDVSKKAHAEYVVSTHDVEENEAKFGKIPPNALVLVQTGWHRFWADPKAYRNEMRFPAISSAAAELLLKRDIAGIAIDTLSPDCLDPTFPVHRILLGHQKYIIENMADASQMPPRGGYCLALPLRGEQMSESPIRLVGLRLGK